MAFLWLLLFIIGAYSEMCLAANTNLFPDKWRARPLYFGALLGYGSTDWSQLVAHCEDPNACFLWLSAPISAGDRGIVWGFFAGYEIQPYFAVETTYAYFPMTPVLFDEFSVYNERFNVTHIDSYTDALSFVGKFMVQMGSTGLRGFANAGGALVRRRDDLAHNIHVTPTFGVGVNYVFPSELMFEVGFQYYAGYGKAVVSPAANYMPFLYSVHAKLAYRIAV